MSVTCSEFGQPGVTNTCPEMPAARAPAGARIQGAGLTHGGSDRHLTIVDQSTGREIDIFHAGFQDYFDRVGTTLGPKWRTPYGRIQTDGTHAVFKPYFDGSQAEVVSPLGSNDVSVAVDVVFPQDGIARRFAVLARAEGGEDDPDYADVGRSYAAQIVNNGNGQPNQVRLLRTGHVSQSTVFASVSHTVNATPRLQLIVTGSNPVRLEVWVDGARVIQTSDSSEFRLSTGTVGVLSGYEGEVKIARFTATPIIPSVDSMISTGLSGWTWVSSGDGTSEYMEATAGHMGNLAGRVRAEEFWEAFVSRGYINHALTITVNCTSGRSIAPAGTNAGRACDRIGLPRQNAPPMGAHIWLDLPISEINQLAVPEWKKVILRTLNKYGAFINDTGSSNYFDIQVESGLQYQMMGVRDFWIDIAQEMRAIGGSQWYDWNDGPGEQGYKGLWNTNEIDWRTLVWNRLKVLDASGSGSAFREGFQTVSATLDSNWNVQQGSFSTDGEYAVSGQPSASGNWARLARSLGSNYSVSAAVVLPPGALSSGVVARSVDASAVDRSLYAAQLSTAGEVKLYRRNDWVWTQLGVASAPIVAGAENQLKLLARGTDTVHLEVWLNGKRVITHDDSSSGRLTSGSAALYTTSAGTKFNGFSVGTAPALYTDDFARTTGLGADWSIRYGSFSTDGKAAISGTPPSNGNWARLAPAVGGSDYSVSTSIAVPSGSVYSGVAARSTDAAHVDKELYSAQIATDGTLNLYRRNNWTWTKLASTAQTITPGTTYALKLAVSGSNPVHLEVWLDGQRRISFDDTSASRLTSGAPAIVNYHANVKYEWFQVDPQ